LREAAGLQRERLGDPGAAAELLRDALEGAPGDADLLIDLVGAEEAAGHPDRALDVVAAALAGDAVAAASRGPLLVIRARLAPAVSGREISVLAASVQDLDAAGTLGVGDLEPALASLLEDLRVVSGESGDEGAEREATMRLASLLPRVGDQRRGLELLVGWVKRNPGDAGAVRGLGQFAANAEKWSAAARAFARLVEITTGAEQVDAAVRLAEACEKGGVPMDARASLEAVYAANPGDDLLRGRLRRMYEAAGAFGELARIMVAEAEQAADDDTRFERLTEAADVSLRAEGGMPTAVDALRRAHALRPDAHAVVMKLADALAGSSAIEEAAQLLDQAIDAHGKRRSPDLSELQYCMARVGRLAGDWEAVFAWLDAAVQTDRQNGAAAAELAVVAMDRDELDTAVKALQAITLLKGECPMSKAEAYLRQGIIAERKGDPKKAVFLAKRALTQDPEYADARAFVERLGG
ncbi:MAG: tetratricopeptide repeat protein, partial [Deltaproteobacteria bacterium]|nr:tetratricopeptide repeat protein [Deltaproteobacteria bacterium]